MALSLPLHHRSSLQLHLLRRGCILCLTAAQTRIPQHERQNKWRVEQTQHQQLMVAVNSQYRDKWQSWTQAVSLWPSPASLVCFCISVSFSLFFFKIQLGPAYVNVLVLGGLPGPSWRSAGLALWYWQCHITLWHYIHFYLNRINVELSLRVLTDDACFCFYKLVFSVAVNRAGLVFTQSMPLNDLVVYLFPIQARQRLFWS